MRVELGTEGKREENSKFMKDLEGNTGDISVLGGILVKARERGLALLNVQIFSIYR